MPGEQRDLVSVASAQRWLMWILLLGILAHALPIGLAMSGGALLGGVPLGLSILLLPFVVLGVVIASLVMVIRISVGLGDGAIVIAIRAFSMFVPVLNLIVLGVVNEQATRALREVGVRVGVMGAARGELEKLVEGHCDWCGYDLRGLEPVAGRIAPACPECGHRKAA